MAKSIALASNQYIFVGFPWLPQTLNFVAKGFIKAKRISSLIGTTDDGRKICFDVLKNTLKHDPVSGDLEFESLVDTCRPMQLAAIESRLCAPASIVMKEDAATSSIVVTESFKIEYNGLRSAPAPILKHAGWELGCSHHLHASMYDFFNRKFFYGDGDLSISIIDDDDTEESETFPSLLHYVVLPWV